MKKLYKVFFLLVLLELNAGGLLAQNNFSTLQGLIDGTLNGQTLTLNSDYTAASNESRLSISGKSITLDLNGHVINRNLSAATTEGNVIYIASDATLTIVDSNPTATHNPAITYTNPNGNAVVTVNGGIIMGGCNNSNGGGVYNLGTLNLNGGTITKSSVITTIFNNGGGGVYNSGIFNMEGEASISGNTSKNIDTSTNSPSSCGGGVSNNGSNATFTLVSGTISNNEILTANNSHLGGGVYNANGALFQMSGGTISGNVVPSVEKAGNGGGVYNGSRFILTGGSIVNNTARFGGGVENSGSFTMEGGTISQNTGCNFGGGVSNSSGTFNFINGSITYNSSNYGASGIYLVNGGTVTMTGGTISNNYHSGVYINTSSSVFNFEGGEITSNVKEGIGINGTCNIRGGQVLSNGGEGVVLSQGTFNMSGGEIKNNSRTGLQLGSSAYTKIANISGGTFENNYTSSSSEVGKGIRVYQGTLNLSDNPAFDANQDICLYCTKTSDDDPNGYRAVITKAGDITSVNAIPVTVGYSNRTNLYDGRNIIESGVGTVTESDYNKFTLLNQTAYNNLLIIDRFTAQDEGTGNPVIELHDLAACWGGSGTSADPYRIEDAADLVCLANEVNAGTDFAGIYFKIMTQDQNQDIDLSGVCGEGIGNWTPIGRWTTPFKGYFDGDDHTITGLYLNGLDDFQGLFGYIADGAQVNNLTLGASTISGKTAVGLVGGMDVSSSSTSIPSINNCTTLSSVNLTGFQFVGGICDYSHGSFSNCTNNATIVGNREVADPGDDFDITCTGGIVGYCNPVDYRSSNATGAYAISMTDCTNNGSVTAADFGEFYAIGVGGIGGLLEGVVLTNCTNTDSAPVTGTAVIGGISGGTDGNEAYPSKFINCSNSGAVTASAIVGGISGDNDGTTNQSVYDNCHNTGTLSSHYAAGGIIGRYNTASAFFGGGSVTTSPVIRNCSNTGAIVLEDGAATFTIAGYTVEWVGNAGGIAALLTEVDIENCTNSGNVTGNTGYAGGIVAEGHSLNISNCHNEGNVQVTDNHELTINDLQGVSMVVGGLVGYTFNSTITASYNTGNVNGGVFTAGIVGFIDSNVEAVSKCFNLGVVESNTQMGLAGGIVGNFSVEDDVTQTTMGINNCYNAGPVIGHGAAGGIAAFCETNVKDCYNVGYIKATDGGVQGLTFNGSAGIVGTFNSDNGIVPTITNCYYDKQMCPTEYDYTRIDLSTFTFEPYTASGDNLLTTNMVGSGMQSMLTPTEWSFVDGLYPQLNVVSSSTNTFDTEASLVSVTPMFLANEETVDQVLTSPFTVGTNNDLEWIHVDGNNLLTFNGSDVSWSNYGTETVAVRHTTDTQIQKLIQVRMTPEPIADGFWPDFVTVMPGGYATDASGNITISSIDGLAWLISVVNGYNGQTADNLQGKTITIDASVTYEMSDHYWVPIGTDVTNYFAGTILTTGGQVIIDGILLPEAGISRTSNVDASVTFNTGAECNDQGLFGYANGAEFHNITIGSNAIVLGERNVGGICGNAQVSDFTYCINNGSITGVDYTGGIAGNVIGTDADHCLVNNCSNNGNINGSGIEPGGIIGHVTLGEIEACYNTGNVSIIGVQGLNDGYAAGICGSFYNSHANNCYNTGTINSGTVLSGGQCACGIIGDSSHNSSYGFDNSITNCYNTGEILGPIATGIVGLCEDGPTTVENCYNTGSITGEAYASGIAAYALYSMISGCYNTGDITVIGVEFNKKEETFVCLVGGIVANAEQSTITDCDNSGAVSFNNASVVAYVAGICASMSNESSVTKCHNSGNIMVNGKIEGEELVTAGGIVATDGRGQNSVISYCSNDGDVTSNFFAGGIWGDMGGDVFYSYNTGTIRGCFAGGISGNAESGNERVINCFNTGNIIGISANESPMGYSVVGGLLGQCVENSILTNCYNTGMVVGYGAAGGLAAAAEHDCAENCYNAGQVTCYPVEAPGMGAMQYGGGLFAIVIEDSGSPASITHCYYDKQMCTQANAYSLMEDGKGRDITVGSFLTTEMLGVNLKNLFGTENDAWIYENGLYPRLAVFDDTDYFTNNDASITSVSPVHLVFTDGTNYQDVDNVTSPFTLRYGDNGNEGSHPVYWQHYGNGSSLYTEQISQGYVGIMSTGNDTLVAMKNGLVYKTVAFHTIRAAGDTWVDVVVTEPEYYDDLDINSPEDLAWFCSKVNGFHGQTAQPHLHGVITADIDLSAHCWVPIGFDYPDVNSSISTYYGGSFDGNYHNIDGINIDYPSLKASPVLNPQGNSKENRDHRDNIGFFGVTEQAYIHNVILASGTISGYNVENYENYMGGMVGFMMEGRIRNCVSNLTLTRSNYEVCMGGLVGRCDSGEILNCTSVATLEANQGMIGGLIGTEELTLISNCYSNAKFNVQPLDKGDYSTYVGGIYGSLRKGESGNVSNCYVLLRDDSEYGLTTKENKDGGGDPHLFGLFAAASFNGSFSHCYVPSGTNYPYVAEASEIRFAKATSMDAFPSYNKEHSYSYTQIATVAGGNQYHIMPWNLNDAFASLTGSTQQVNSVEFLSDSYDDEEQFRIDRRTANDNTNHYGIRHKEGNEYDLGYDNNTGMLVGNISAPNPTWDIEQFPGESSFKVSNYPNTDICLALHNNGDGTYTFGAYDYTIYGSDPNYDFHINFFTETEIPSDGNLYGCGTFTAPSYPYTYSDPRGGSIVTLDNADENDYATSGETTLLDALNNWEVGNYIGTPDYNTYLPDPDWARFGSALNGDYPVHCYYDPDNVKPADASTEIGGDQFSPTAKVVVTTDKVKGYPFRYYHHVADALAYCNAQTNGGIVCVYGSDDMRGAATQENDADVVDVYVNCMSYMQCDKLKSGEPYSYYTFFGDNAATKSTDWYVSLLQDENKHLTVTTGFNLDNSDATDFAGANYDWHMVSSPLEAIPVGIVYIDEIQHGINNLPECNWDNNADGLFPDDTPYNSFDFYAYSEPNYHWMNFKRNSNSHWYQDTGEHIDGYVNDQILVPGHGYLIAMDKEVFMQAKGELTNREVEVGVTYSGAHNKGLNYLGNPYQSSLDFDAFVAGNSSLWGTEGNNYYQSYLLLDADAHCYKYYVKTQSDNPELPSRYIWPFQGFYVGVDADGTARFTNNMRVIGVNAASYMHKGESVQNAYPLVNLKVTDDEGKSDMFTVELDRPEWGGGRKEKDMTAGSGILWSSHEGKEYSILFSGVGVEEIPVRFSAKNSGTFTMTWSHYNGDFTYLHLIDNMTGVDIDCLTTDSYSFEGKTEDYQSRFKLVFSVSGEDEDDDDDVTTDATTFAFQMGDKLVVNGEGLLQMFDVNGRCLLSTEVHGQQNTISLPTTAAGVYVLRMTSGSQVKTQKMVVR